MKFDGTVNIKAPRDKVWEFVTDADAVSKCAPGLDSMEIVTPGEKFKVVASVGFGTVKVTFNTDVEWVDLDPPNKAGVKAHGDAPGSAIDALGEMVLTDGADDTTDMAWTVDVTVSGTIAALASRMMGGITKRLTNAFFDCMKKQIEA
jgi:carbon monoxide dehydrogenase subunit G